MTFKKWYIIICYLLFALPGLVSTQEITFKLFDSRDGLPSSRVTALTQDWEGHLWVGTEAGLVRYNGISFRTFYKDTSYQTARVNALASDSTGTVWIGTSSGLDYFRNGVFHEFSQNGLDSTSIQYLLVDSKNTIYATSLYHFYIITKKSNTSYSVVKHRISTAWYLKEGVSGKIWIGSPTPLMIYADGYLQTILNQPQEVEGGIVGVYEDDKGILLGTKEDNVYQLDYRKKQRIPVRPYDEYYHDFRSIEKWIDARWIVYGWGLLKLTEAGQDFVSYPDIYNIKYVTATFVDRDNNFWIATTEGLLLARKSLFKAIDHPDIRSEIYSIYESPDNNLWFGGNRGEIYQLDKAKNLTLWQGPDSFGGEIMDIEEDSAGHLWFASYWQGLVYWDGVHVKRYEVNEIDPVGPDIYDIHIDPTDQLWIGSTRGLFSITSGISDTFTSYNTSGIPEQCDVYKICSESNLVWIASSCGLYKYNGHDILPVELPDIQHTSHLRSIHASENELWLGTLGHGLRCYRLENNQLVFDRVIHEPARSVLDIVGDQSTIWAGTPTGLIKVNLLSEQDDYEAFTQSDGFFDEGFAYLKLFLSSNKTLYITTSQGIKTLAKTVKRKSPLRQILFDQILVDGRTINLNQKEINLPSNTKVIEISYYLPDLTDSDLIRYQWRMQDQQNWSSWTQDRKIVLYNPKSATYHLEIKAKKADKITGTVNISFAVMTPWFAEPLTMVLFGISLGLLVYFFIRRREQKVKLQQKLEMQRALTMASLESKALRSQMNPHFLFNILNNLQEMILTGATKQAHNYLTKFSQLMRMILNISSKEYVKIEKEVEFLTLYLELEQLRFDHQFAYALVVDPDLFTFEIPVFMIQPLVENAIRHGLLPLQDGRKLHITVDGVGLDRDKIRGKKWGNDTVRALDLIRQRLNILSHRSGLACSLEIKSNPESHGVQVNLQLPAYPVL